MRISVAKFEILVSVFKMADIVNSPDVVIQVGGDPGTCPRYGQNY